MTRIALPFLGAALLAGCATTPATQVRDVRQLRDAYALAQATAAAYAVSAYAKPAVVSALDQADAAALGAIEAYAAAPSDDPKMQAADMAVAALMTAVARQALAR